MKNLHTFVVLAYKESKYLEECIQSVINQEYQSKVIIATTTDNEYIRNTAKKYNIDVVVGKHTNIGGDFDFAVSVGKTELVTVAHQDDIYEKSYSKKVVETYNKNKDSSIIFTDYYEIKGENKVYSNLNLKIKRIILTPLKNQRRGNKRFFKRWVLRFGNSISCPAVTFVKKNCPNEIFASEYKSNVDWYAWAKLSNLDGRFAFVNEKLMGHRISEESTTTDIIKQGIRTKEDYAIYSMFWPKFIAKILAKAYKSSEKSNGKIDRRENHN